MDDAKPVAVFPADPSADEGGLADALAAIEDSRSRVAASDTGRLLAALGHAAKTVRRRAAGAVAAALRDGDLDAAAVQQVLHGADGAARWGAAFALSRAGLVGPAVVDAAVEALEDDDGDVRWAAASIVVPAARSSPALRASLAAAARGPRPLLRKMALLCLEACGERDPALFVASLRDDDAFVRLAALTALGRLGDASAAQAVTRVASDDAAANVRRAAAAVAARLEAGGAAGRKP